MLPEPSTTNITMGGVLADCTTALAHTFPAGAMVLRGVVGLAIKGPPVGESMTELEGIVEEPGAGAVCVAAPLPAARPGPPRLLPLVAALGSLAAHANSGNVLRNHNNERVRSAHIAIWYPFNRAASLVH
jgi:hypothetical protein